jgi:D-threo-aldose 1-dehydrogenase
MNPVERVPLGRTTLTVTRLGLGTAPLGGMYRAVEDSDAYAVAIQAWNAGLRFFDTAPLYGLGLAERRLGAILRDRPRHEFTMSTKVGRLLEKGAPPEPGQSWHGAPRLNPVFDFSYDGVMRSFEASLKRLGLERVDILHIHDPDDHFDEALNGAYRALDKLRGEKLIGALGAGMNQAEMLARFARSADFDCFLLAGRYTLLDQVGLTELLPLCLEKGNAIIVGGAFNSGLLADPSPDAHYNYGPVPTAILERALRLPTVCARHGVPLKAAALQCPFGHAAVAGVLIGPRSTAELEDNLAMFRVEIPADLWADLKAEHLLSEEVPTP